MPLLFLMRHGPADGGGDPGLSIPGQRLIERAARGMRALGMGFEAIHSSPLQRAMQTAAIVAETLGHPGGWAVLPEAAPGASLDLLAPRLAALLAGGPVLVVGHQPDMGRMAMQAIGSRNPVPFMQGTLCGVELGDWSDLEEGRHGLARLLVPAEALALVGQDHT